MPWIFHPWRQPSCVSYEKLLQPIINALKNMPELQSRGNRPLKMYFEEQLRVLVYCHPQEHTSAQHLLQTLKEDDFAKQYIAPGKGIEKSSFSEAISNGDSNTSYLKSVTSGKAGGLYCEPLKAVIKP